MNASPTMTKLFFILVYSLYEKKFQRFKISKIKNFKDPKFQNLKISISKKKVARSDFREFQLQPPPGFTLSIIRNDEQRLLGRDKIFLIVTVVLPTDFFDPVLNFKV